MQIVKYISGEWAVIGQSPLTFIIALTLLGGAIWAVIEKLYKQELSTKAATIEHLRERLEYKAVVALESVGSRPTPEPSSDKPQGPVPATPTPAPASVHVVDPDAIYQRGQIVGRVVAPRVHQSVSRVTFEAITDTSDLDRKVPFQYRDMTLTLISVERSFGMNIVLGPNGSRTLRDVIEGVECQII